MNGNARLEVALSRVSVGEARENARPRRTPLFLQPRAHCLLPRTDQRWGSIPHPGAGNRRRLQLLLQGCTWSSCLGPLPGHPPTLASPRIPEIYGQNKSKRASRASDCFSEGEQGEEAWGARPGPRSDVKPDSPPAAARPPQQIRAREC